MGYEIDFMNVGTGERSGDAIALRFGEIKGNTPNQTVVVIDGGTQEAGGLLVSHICEYYKTDTINLVVSTHPDSDHASGLNVVINEMDVEKIWMHKPWNHAEEIRDSFHDGRITNKSIHETLKKSLETAYSLEQLAKARGIPIEEPFAGLCDDTGSLRVLGPSEQFYESLLPYFRSTPEPKESQSLIITKMHAAKEYISKVVEDFNIETLDNNGVTSAENDSSTIILLEVDSEYFLFTSDAGIPALTDVAERCDNVNFDLKKCSSLQVPHHGSRRNVGPAILDRIVGPKLKDDVANTVALVSVSAGGEPKHPSKKVTNALRRRGARVYPTKSQKICHSHDADPRPNWHTLSPLPFYSEVEG